MNALYSLAPESAADYHALDSSSLDDIIEKVMRAVHSGEFGSGKISVDLHQQLLKEFKKSLGQYGKTMAAVDYATVDYNTIAALRNNLSAFSAAKTYSQIKAMNALLIDENGNIRSYRDFKDLALQVHKDYNRNWLQTEYNTAVGNAQMAARWNDIQSNEESTHITIYTAGDERVRDEHAGYDGFTRPKNDAIWRTFWPPFDWACRCYAIEGIDEENSADDPELRSIPGLFKNNAGMSGMVFKSEHPYFRDVDGKITELRAVENYGFKSIARMYADVTKLPTFVLSPKEEVWSNMRALYPYKENAVLYSADSGYKAMLSRDVFDAANTHTSIHTVIASADEQWLGAGGEMTYLKYYKSSVYLIKCNAKGKVIEMKSIQPEMAEEIRKGVPI